MGKEIFSLALFQAELLDLIVDSGEKEREKKW
jgi:hypothetical protein